MIHFAPKTPERPVSTAQSATEREIAALLVETLNLEGVTPGSIEPEAPLFGAGLGLDSIDALELALEISKRYGLKLKAEDEDNKRIFSSLHALAAHVDAHRTA
jgi:acyl carrier protein